MKILDNSPIIDTVLADNKQTSADHISSPNEHEKDKRGNKMKTLLSFIFTIALLVGIGYLGVKILDNAPIKDPVLADKKQALANQVSQLNEKVKDKFNQMKKNLDSANKPAGDAKGDPGKDNGRLRVPKGYGPIDEEDMRLTGDILREQTLPKTGENQMNDKNDPAQEPLTESDSYQYKPEDLKRLGLIRELYAKASEALNW